MSEIGRPSTPHASLPALWKTTVRVHSYEVDFAQRLTLESLCRYYQEAAWDHAEALGIGFRHLQAQGKLWVLLRMAIHLNRPPTWGETLQIQTWPRPPKAAMALRDFQILDQNQGCVAAGTSIWLVLDAQTRKPQRLDSLFDSLPSLSTHRALAVDPPKLPEVSSLPQPPTTRTVCYSDIDVNGHVNGARYIGWIMDSYALKFHRTHRPLSIEVNYLEETHPGETISIFSSEVSPGVSLHSIERSGTPLFRARLSWGQLPV